jgi:hypothetical protein
VAEAVFWQTSDLDYLIAEEIFGWKWLAYIGIPVRGTPGYPQTCRVRRFFPPETLSQESYEKWAVEHEAGPATGAEPLDYAYCSSCGPAPVPHFSGHAEAARMLEKELHKRGRTIWERYLSALAECVEDGEPLQLASCDAKCLAALVAIDSPNVRRVSQDGE